MQLRTGSNHDTLPLSDVEKEFALEMSDANKWFAGLRRNEEAWIAQGLNPDEEFERQYRSTEAPATPVSGAEREDPDLIRDRRLFRVALFLEGSLVVAAALIATTIIRRLARRSTTSDVP